MFFAQSYHMATQLQIGQRIQWRANGRTVNGFYWGVDNGQHCAKRSPSDWVLHYLNADSIMVPA